MLALVITLTCSLLGLLNLGVLTSCPLRFKARIAEVVVEAALETFSRPLVVWSGGKDSTVVLHIVRNVANRLGKSFDVVFIDHYMHFEETLEFINKVAGEWGLRLFIKGNERLRGLQVR